MSGLFNKMNNELSENVLKDAFTWIKNKFIETFKFFNVGVAKTVQGLYNLFDKDGNKILKNDAQRITASKRGDVIAIKDKNIYLQASSNPSIPSFGVKYGKNAAIFKVFGKIGSPVSESTYTNIKNKLYEYNQVDLDYELDTYDDDIGAEKQIMAPIDITTSHVDYKKLEDALAGAIDNLSISKDNTIISIVGDSGIGKTEIVKALAKDRGMNFFYVELGKIDKALITGMAVVDRELEGSGESKKFKNSINMTMASSIFPSNADQTEYIKKAYNEGAIAIDVNNSSSSKWIIFLDEFNRAPAKVTSIIMNMFIDGQITAAIKSVYDPVTKKHVNVSSSGSIKLPENSLYVVGQNESQEDGENIGSAIHEIEDLDIATTSRLLQTFILKSDVESWHDNYGSTPTSASFENDEELKDVPIYPVVPRIFMNIIKELDEKYKSAGGAFKIPYANSVNNLASMDPRRWSNISKAYYKKAWAMWRVFSKEKKYSPKRLEVGWKAYQSMKNGHETAGASLESKTSRLTLERWGKFIDKFNGMEKEEISKLFAFTGWAATNFKVTRDILNDQDLASYFGAGMAGDDGSTRKQNIESFRRDMFAMLVRQANATIPNEDFLFGYSAIRDNDNDKGKPKNELLNKIGNKIKDVYGVDGFTGKKDRSTIDTVEIASKINATYRGVGIGEEKKYYIERKEFTQKGQPVEILLPGNIKTALGIINSKGLNDLKIQNLLREEGIDELIASKKIPFTKSITTKIKSMAGKISTSQGWSKIPVLYEELIKIALAIVAEATLTIVKDFSDNSEDIVKSVESKLLKNKNTFDNTSEFSELNFEQNKIPMEQFESPYFQKSFSELLIMLLNNNEDFQKLGGTKANTTKNSLGKLANELDDEAIEGGSYTPMSDDDTNKPTEDEDANKPKKRGRPRKVQAYSDIPESKLILNLINDILKD